MQGTFELNGEKIVVSDQSPTTTVLEWLRATGRVGTKEGCAEGDCGACTIAILDHHSVVGPTWRSVCSCIMLLPQIFGHRLVTVEGLATNESLHPAQDAMVEALGSQCGYCTPGFVMSLFEATYRTDLDSPWQKDDQICGNLCRCTGYRPIRDALEEVAGRRPNDHFLEATGSVTAPPAVTYVTETQSYARPDTWEDLWSALDRDDVRLVNGATDLGLHVTQRHQNFKALVDLGGLAELREIQSIDGGFLVGAGVRLADLEAWSIHRYPAMSKMLRFFASRQIKNRATIGGNLCNASPIGDLPPVMLALDAVAVIRSKHGERRVVFGPPDAESIGFWTDYRKTVLKEGEILAGIELPIPSPSSYIASYKVSKRRELDISAVAGAFSLTVNPKGMVAHIRLAYGGMAATPIRAYAVENQLLGEPLTEKNKEAAVDAVKTCFQPLTDHRGSAWYRAEVASNLLHGFFIEYANGAAVDLPDRPSGTVFARGTT